MAVLKCFIDPLKMASSTQTANYDTRGIFSFLTIGKISLENFFSFKIP